MIEVPSYIRPSARDPKYGDCDRCGAICITVAVHQCPPAFRVFDPEQTTEDRAVEVRAFNAEDAALKYADREDSDRHEMGILTHGVIVTVIANDGTRSRFRLTGESVPSYDAEALDD